jgi:Ca2+-binding RTX toxin-like protein
MGNVFIDLNTSISPIAKSKFYEKSDSLIGTKISEKMFGVNFLSSFERGDNFTGGGNYDDILRALGNSSNNGSGGFHHVSAPISTLRFPGGALTENYFANSNVPFSIHQAVNYGSKSGISAKDFIDFSAKHGNGMTQVIPTFRYLGSNGLTESDRLEISSYVKSLLAAALAKGVNVTAFELGNEYWNKMTVDGVKNVGMTAAEYGKIAADQAVVIQSTIDQFARENSRAINRSNDWESPKILLQIGAPWGDDDNISRMKAQVDSQAIINAFTTVEQRSAIDGFVAHRYESTIDHVRDPFVMVKPLHFTSLSDMLHAEGWKDYNSMALAVSEWNLDQGSKETGLRSFAMVVSLMGEMAALGVDSADFWSAAARSKFPLARFEGGNYTPDAKFAGLTFTGEAFRMMNESLQGKQVVQLYDKSGGKLLPLNGNKLDMASGDNLRTNIEAFSDGRELVLFVSNLSGQSDKVTLDLAGMIGKNAYHAWGSLVKSSSANLLDNNAAPIIYNMNLNFEKGVLNNFELGAYETLRITITLGTGGAGVYGYDGADVLDGSAYGDTISGRDGNDELNGVGGNDSIFGGQGNDKLIGGDGNDFLYGGDGADTLEGGAGNDRLFGGDGNDTAIYLGNAKVNVDIGITTIQNTGAGFDALISIENVITGNGNDIVYGNDAVNQLIGGNGNDNLHGRGGDDRLFGGVGYDTINGGQGNDALYGENGYDSLVGDMGNDTLEGGNGDDRLFGGDGQDLINGGAGTDVLFGGRGADVFVFAKLSGKDTISDFELDIDKIQLTNRGETFARLSIVNTASGVAITHEPGDVITILGVKSWQLDAADFIFG